MRRGSAAGRPVRFFTIVMGGWLAIRLSAMAGDMFIALTTPRFAERPGRLTRASAARPSPPLISEPHTRPADVGVTMPTLANSRRDLSLLRPLLGGNRPPRSGTLDPAPPSVPILSSGAPVEDGPPPGAPNPAPALPLARGYSGPDHWQGSAWLLWRAGSATRADAVTGGRLGGSQAGLRLDLDLTPGAKSRAVAYARASAAMNRPYSPEAAIGMAYQPSRAIPISIAAERRIALGEGGRDANSVMAVGGFGPTPVGKIMEAEAYAQGGMVGFRARDFFVDGKFSLLSRIKDSPMRAGASISGGAQPGAERLDIGPELQIRLPLSPVQSRLAVEWRERIAGHAAPASGLAVTLGADF